MPDIKLGPVGQELTLPKPRYRSGPSWPIMIERNIEEAEMSDGSYNYNFKSEERHVWPFEWDLLTRAQLEDFEWLRRFKTSLHFQNTWDDETWYTVIMTSYEREPLIDVHTDEVLFRVRLTLKEVKGVG
jgi:hypothetical protein